jgi:hypothetical protein
VNNTTRRAAYLAQTGRKRLTPRQERQLRRMSHKAQAQAVRVRTEANTRRYATQPMRVTVELADQA